MLNKIVFVVVSAAVFQIQPGIAVGGKPGSGIAEGSTAVYAVLNILTAAAEFEAVTVSGSADQFIFR